MSSLQENPTLLHLCLCVLRTRLFAMLGLGLARPDSWTAPPSGPLAGWVVSQLFGPLTCWLKVRLAAWMEGWMDEQMDGSPCQQKRQPDPGDWKEVPPSERERLEKEVAAEKGVRDKRQKPKQKALRSCVGCNKWASEK